MGHQLHILEWFLDLKISMIIDGFNSSGTFPISLTVLYTFIDVFKNVILKPLLECHQGLVFYPVGGTRWFFELPPKICFCIWTHSYLM